MARRLRAGFEDRSTDIFNSVSGASVVASTGLDMDGGYCLDCTSDTNYVGRTFSADTEDYSALLFRPLALSVTQIIGYFAGATLLANLSMDATGHLLVYSGESTLLATSTLTIAANTTVRIEAYYKIADSPDGG